MNLQENIKKVLKEETNIIAKRLIKKIFDNVFNKLNLIPIDEELLMDWVNVDGKKMFQRNWWGKFWVDDCEVYKNLYSKTLFLSLDIDEFETNLLEYLNTKYEKEFKDRPLKEIGDEHFCFEDD